MNDSIIVFLPHLMKFTQAIHSYLRTNRISTHVYNRYLYLSCTQKKEIVHFSEKRYPNQITTYNNTDHGKLLTVLLGD